MKYFCFSDIHGCIDELLAGLERSGFDTNNENHHLLFLGDAFDKNRKDYEMFMFLKKYIEMGKLTWIYGNHETYLLNALDRNEPNKFSLSTIRNLSNGFDPSSASYSDRDCLKVVKENGVDSFIRDNCIDFFETKDYVFTHGSIPYNRNSGKYDPAWREYPHQKWERFRNLNGMKTVIDGIRIPSKTLVCGHIGSYFGSITKMYDGIDIASDEFKKIGDKMKRNSKKDPKPFEIFHGDGVIGIDGRCFDTGIVNILIIEDEPVGGCENE